MAHTVRQAIITSNLTIYSRSGVANVNAQDTLINGVDENIYLNSATTPDVDSPPYTADLVCTGGTDTIDLLDGLTDPDGVAISLNGKKLRAIKLKAKTTNAAGGITIIGGASNGYLLFGTAGSIILTPGQSLLYYLENDGVTIDATHTNISYTGTLNDVLEVVAIFG